MNKAREDLKKSLRRRKDIAIEENDTHYQEINTTKLFVDENTSEFDATVVDLMEENRTLPEEIRNIKIEKESQAILLCEVTEQKKKAMEDKIMIEDDERFLTRKLEEESLEINKIAHIQLETMNQVMISNHEINSKDIEITTLKLQN